MTTEFAPAKINLFLHVGHLAADDFHPLDSWMMFADVGDEVRLTRGGEGFSVEGPFADGVPVDATNLCIKARDAFLAGREVESFGLTLTKNLPMASGIGGGSSDAAAVLRLLQRLAPIQEAELFGIAAKLGSDVPPCLRASSVIARGRGEQLFEAPTAPPLPVVLVNPGVHVSTREIFGLFDRDPPPTRPLWTGRAAATAEEAIALLADTGNDLQPPAEALAPQITAALGQLAADRRCRLVRMSGSGATCFGLTATRDDAASVAAEISLRRPDWWVKATVLS